MFELANNPAFPTELFDLIIDHLAYGLLNNLQTHDKRYLPHVLAPLVACSLVSKAFHDRTSYHIFSTIILNESNSNSESSEINSPRRKQTIAGLLDILDSDYDETFRSRVHTLKLHTAPIRLPAKSAWGEVDQDFPTILNDAFLPRVLHKLPRICSLHLVHHYPEPFRYSALSEDMKLGIEAILRGPCISDLKLGGFSVLPSSLFARCLHLIDFDYYASQLGRAQKVAYVPHNSVEPCHPPPFNLRHTRLTGCDEVIQILIAGVLAGFELSIEFAKFC